MKFNADEKVLAIPTYNDEASLRYSRFGVEATIIEVGPYRKGHIDERIGNKPLSASADYIILCPDGVCWYAREHSLKKIPPAQEENWIKDYMEKYIVTDEDRIKFKDFNFKLKGKPIIKGKWVFLDNEIAGMI